MEIVSNVAHNVSCETLALVDHEFNEHESLAGVTGLVPARLVRRSNPLSFHSRLVNPLPKISLPTFGQGCHLQSTMYRSQFVIPVSLRDVQPRDFLNRDGVR